MIDNLTISGVKYELTDTTKKYVTKKIGALDKYLPRHARKSVSADVKIKQIGNPDGNKYEVEVMIQLILIKIELMKFFHDEKHML